MKLTSFVLKANDEILDNLNAFLGHMVPYFPFREGTELATAEPMSIKVIPYIS
jgi:hypothetical protein